MTLPTSPFTNEFSQVLAYWKGGMNMEATQSKWFWVLGAVLALTLTSWPALAGEKQPPGGKVAVVNGSVINRADFDRKMSNILQRLSSKGKSLSDSQVSEIKKGVLENLINSELLYQESQKQGITVDEMSVNEQLRKLKERFPSEAEFKSALNKANLSEDAMKSQVKRGMAIQRFIDKQFVQIRKLRFPRRRAKPTMIATRIFSNNLNRCGQVTS